MCRNIRPLFNFEPPASRNEMHDAALQFVRKISGYTHPSKVNEAAFSDAVDDIERVVKRLLKGIDARCPAAASVNSNNFCRSSPHYWSS